MLYGIVQMHAEHMHARILHSYGTFLSRRYFQGFYISYLDDVQLKFA